MPYYIYLIKQPFTQLNKLAEHSSFNEASAQAKASRLQQSPDATEKIKVIFAENELQAEDLLSQVRTPGPKGDD